jgi:hypothetical protein
MGNPDRELSGPHVVESLGEFVLCDLALSLGRSQRHVYFLRGGRIEHRTSCDLLFQRLQ